jgi:hypothetical protein
MLSDAKSPKKNRPAPKRYVSISKGYGVNLKKSPNLPEVIIIYPIFVLPVNIGEPDKSVDNFPIYVKHRTFFAKFGKRISKYFIL